MGRDWDRVRGGDALEGFGFGAWAVVITLAAFGFVTSVVVKHLSNIAKVFNSAFGIVVTARVVVDVSRGETLVARRAERGGCRGKSVPLLRAGTSVRTGEGRGAGACWGPGAAAGVLQRLRAGVRGGGRG